MTEPTPRPWTTRGGRIYGADDDPIASTGVSSRWSEEDKANEKLIVRAVNAHDELVAALKCLVKETEYMWEDADLMPECTGEALIAARAALAKAGAT